MLENKDLQRNGGGCAPIIYLTSDMGWRWYPILPESQDNRILVAQRPVATQLKTRILTEMEVDATLILLATRHGLEVGPHPARGPR